MKHSERVLVDFHTHILPKIDDGSRRVDLSVKMLERLHKQGVDCCVLTPHYYKTKEPIEEFIKRREESYRILKEACDESRSPLLSLGAEVHMSHGLSDVDLSPLCMGNSNVMMVEFPIDKLQYWMMDEIEHIAFEQNIVPMVAHVDRLMTRYKEKDLQQLFEFEDFIFQINNDSILNLKKRFSISKYYEDWRGFVIGSDTHDMSRRAPNFDKVLKKIDSVPLGNKFAENVLHTSEYVAQCIFGKNAIGKIKNED